MDKELAESYIKYQLGSMNFSPKIFISLWWFNVVLGVISVIMHHTMLFITAIVVLLIAHLLVMLRIRRVFNTYTFILASGVHSIFIGIVFDFCIYAMYCVADRMVYSDFCITIATQIFFLFLSMYIVPRIAKRHNKEKKARIFKYTWGFALLMGSIGRIGATIFSIDGMQNYLVDFFGITLGFCVYLWNYNAVNAVYCTRLIKKFHLEIDLEQLAMERLQNYPNQM